MKSDIQIAREASMRPVMDIGERLGIPPEQLVPYGHTKPKVKLDFVESLRDRANGKLILVTAMSPTPAGEGKTTVAIGLADAMNQIGKETTVACIEDPSVAPRLSLRECWPT